MPRMTGHYAHSLVGFNISEWPSSRGNCMSIKADDGHAYWLADIHFENFMELEERGELTGPLELQVLVAPGDRQEGLAVIPSLAVSHPTWLLTKSCGCRRSMATRELVQDYLDKIHVGPETDFPDYIFDSYGRKFRKPLEGTMGMTMSKVVKCMNCDKKIRWVPPHDRLPSPLPLCSIECFKAYDALDNYRR